MYSSCCVPFNKCSGSELTDVLSSTAHILISCTVRLPDLKAGGLVRNYAGTQSKMVYYEHKFNSAKKLYKANFWRIINNIINTKNRKVENIVKKIIRDEIVNEDSEDEANTFNDYFVYITKNIAESIEGNNNNNLDYTTHINQPDFFSPIHYYYTEKLICSPKNKYIKLNTTPVKN